MSWHTQSGVIACDTCDGQGSYWNGRGNGGNDPDSFDIECRDCEGQGHDPCAVCGFDQVVTGYDCAVCDHVSTFTAEDLKAIDAAAFAQSFVVALDVARAAESYAPGVAA